MAEQREHIGCIEDADSTFCDSGDCWCATPPTAPVATAELADDLLMHANSDLLPGWVCIPAGEWEGSILPRLKAKPATAETAQPYKQWLEQLDMLEDVFGRTGRVGRDDMRWLFEKFTQMATALASPPPQPAGTPFYTEWDMEGARTEAHCAGQAYAHFVLATKPPTGTPEPLREALPGTFREWWFNVGYKHMPKGDQPPEHAAIAELAWNAALAAVPQASPSDYAAFVALAEQWDRCVNYLRKVNTEGTAQRAVDFCARAAELRATIAAQRKGQP